MTRAQHLRQAEVSGLLAVLAADRNPRAAAEHATVAVHHALAAQECWLCDGGRVENRLGRQTSCRLCLGKGWFPCRPFPDTARSPEEARP